jgi:hypothetical protein
MFEKCCNNNSAIKYKIYHDPKPLVLSYIMDNILKKLLWYVPNIDSYQAKKNNLISDKVYDDFLFTYIMEQMDMVEDRDVKWIEPNNPFDDDDWNYYESSICNKCQKIIITRQKSLSKTNDLLRVLRNCIAHGHFAIVDDFIVGFNKHTTIKNPIGVKKAVIKIKPQLLLAALESLSSGMGKELLVAYAFKKVGYTIINERNEKSIFDLIIEKNGKQYVIEIKDYQGSAYLYPEHIESFLLTSNHLLSVVERVLFIDTSRVTKAVRKIEKEIDNFRIIDLSEVKLLLQENPVDILTSVEE